MAYSNATMEDRYFRSVDIGTSRMGLIKKTYAMLSLSVISAVFGVVLALQVPALLSLFSGWIGWIIAMVLLNGIPMIAMACRHNPVLGTLALLADGFVAGLILGPAVFIAGMIAGAGGNGSGLTSASAANYTLVYQAAGLTALVFGAVTLAVWTSGRRYSAPKGLIFGIFIAIIGAIVLNIFMPIGILGIIIAAAIGILGVLILVYGTGDVIYGDVDTPIEGALILFAGLFNVFTAILHLLMAFGGDD